MSNAEASPETNHPQSSASLEAPANGASDENPDQLETTPSGSLHGANIDLLKEVELGVTLRFGERRVLLRDILELAPGAVIELDQQVEDPVELLVGNKVIARGEVVVVDGNYGLRVTEIVSPAERIESLRR